MYYRSQLDIEDKDWHVCKICNLNIKELAKKYGGGGKYYNQVFKKHLEIDHSISLNEYFENSVKIIRPKCLCNICNQFVDVKMRGSILYFSKYKCGRNPGVLKWSEQAKETRRGKNNPMYGKTPWSKGLTKNTSESLRISAEKRKGLITSETTKKKQSDSAKKRKIHGHSGKHHSEKTKEFLRKNTLRLIKEGVFKQTKTKCHTELCKILTEMKISFEEEKILNFWCFDVYIEKYNLYIEADGDYFHSNPKIYPNGPKTKTQKINFYRDIKKNKFCIENNINLLRFWESDILNNKKLIKEQIKCKLKELLQLKE